MKLKHVPFHWLDNCVSQIKFVSTFVNVIFPWCQWWHPMPSYLGCQIFTEHVNFSQLFTLPQYKQGTHSHSHTPISNNTVAVLKWCAVGYIQICTEWEEKEERDGRIWPTLPSVSDSLDLQLKVTAIYFLTNISTPMKHLPDSKTSWRLFLPQYLGYCLSKISNFF